MFEPTTFKTGHDLRDNTVGDLDLWCPQRGKVLFAHLGIVTQILSCEVQCPACGQLIRESGDDGTPA